MTDTLPKDVPNPGSDKALAAGCRCPVLDNAHGKGSMYGPGTFWYSADCPVHPPVAKVVEPREEEKSCSEE